MRRGRIQLKKIENKINRQVTFSKRRSGLLKKAHEVSVLCDAEVALVVFSDKGKLFEYATDSCMEKVLERYERYSHKERQLLENANEAQGNWTLEHAKLKARMEVLLRNQRHFMGEDLENLRMKELLSVEQQLDCALKNIRSRKNQLMHESISELQKKDKALQDQNKILLKKIKEKEITLADQAPWKEKDNGHSIFISEPMQSLNMSSYQVPSGAGVDHEDVPQDVASTVLPPWMLGHIKY